MGTHITPPPPPENDIFYPPLMIYPSNTSFAFIFCPICIFFYLLTLNFFFIFPYSSFYFKFWPFFFLFLFSFFPQMTSVKIYTTLGPPTPSHFILHSLNQPKVNQIKNRFFFQSTIMWMSACEMILYSFQKFKFKGTVSWDWDWRQVVWLTEEN